MHARGADFSSAQTVEHVKAIAGKLDFAFVKFTQGTGYVNLLAWKQRNALETHGVFVGAYHFLTADADGAAQWDHFEKTLGGLRIPVAVDHEPDHGVMPPDYIVRAFIKRGHQRGYKVGRYGDGRVIRRNLGEDWTWAAWWGPTPPPFKWHIWQFSDGGGRQDWNVFNGDKEALAKWLEELSFAHRHRPRVPLRWWLHDDFAKVARGPYRLPRLGAAVVAYLARHRTAGRLRLERK